MRSIHIYYIIYIYIYILYIHIYNIYIYIYIVENELPQFAFEKIQQVPRGTDDSFCPRASPSSSWKSPPWTAVYPLKGDLSLSHTCCVTVVRLSLNFKRNRTRIRAVAILSFSPRETRDDDSKNLSFFFSLFFSFFRFLSPPFPENSSVCRCMMFKNEQSFVFFFFLSRVEYQLRFGGTQGWNGSKSLNTIILGVSIRQIYNIYIYRERERDSVSMQTEREKKRNKDWSLAMRNCSICLNNRNTVYKLMVIVIHCRQSLVFSLATRKK